MALPIYLILKVTHVKWR